MAVDTFRDRRGRYEFPEGTRLSNTSGLDDIVGAVFVTDDDPPVRIPVLIRRSTTGSEPRMEVIDQSPGVNPRDASSQQTLEQAEFDQLKAAATAAIIERTRTAGRPPVTTADGQYIFGPDTREVEGSGSGQRQLQNVVFQPTGGGPPQLVTLTTAPGVDGPVYRRVDAQNPSASPATIDAAAYNGVRDGAAAQPSQGPAQAPDHGTRERPNWGSTGVPFPEARSTRDMVMDALRRRGVDMDDPEAVRQAIMQIQRGIREAHPEADLGPFGEQGDGIDGRVGPFTTRGLKIDRGITDNRPLTQADVDAAVNDHVPQGGTQVQPVTAGLNVDGATVDQAHPDVIGGVTYTPQTPPGSQPQPGEIRRTGTEGSYTYAFHPAGTDGSADVPLQVRDWQTAQQVAERNRQQSQATPNIDSRAATFGENGVIQNVTYTAPGQNGAAGTPVEGTLVRVTDGGTTRYEFRSTDGNQTHPATQADYETAARGAAQRELAGMSTNRFFFECRIRA